MEDSLDLLIGAKVKWNPDSLRIADVGARHIGRPVTFDYLDTSKPVTDYEGSVRVVGVLEGVFGDSWLVSGFQYSDDRIENMKTYRRSV